MSRGTQVPAVSLWVSGTGLSPALAELSSSFPLPTHESHMPALQPRLNESSRFGLIPFRSPLLWESRLISFPSGTEMFHFPELALDTLCIQVPATEHDLRRVSPFRNPRITECLASPRGFSQLTTSSSPSDAKASTRCSCQLVFSKKTSFHPYSIVKEQSLS